MSKVRRNQRQQQRSKVTFSKLTFHKLNWLEYLTIGLSVWFLFFPKPYEILFTVLLCMPIIGLILNGLTGRPSITSLVEIWKDKDGNDKYDVADFIDIAAWVILFRVIIDYKFESFYSLIIPGTVAFAIMLIILFATHNHIINTDKSKTWIYLSLIVNVFLYSYAGAYGANCVYDNSEPTVYQAEVVNKRISRGRRGSKSYILKVTPWGHHYDQEEISVTSDQYNGIQTGQTVNIDLKEGLFNIPWFYVE
jgi:hypothetical protein